MADPPRISHIIPTSPQTLLQIQKGIEENIAEQVESDEDLQQYYDTGLAIAYRVKQEAKRFEELREQRSEEPETEKAEEEKIAKVEKPEEAASRFQSGNYELNSRTLLILRSRIKAGDTPEEILEKVLSVYTDPALADEALDFLIETADPGVLTALKEAKEQLNTTFGREVKAGRNMGAQAREFSKEGLGSPTSLRDLYRDVTGTARDPLKLFDEFAEKFRYDKLKTVVQFLLHSLGSDLKAKGSSISRLELKRLIDETRSLQGILGVFRFFQSRMQLIQRLFASSGLTLPSRIDFETLAKLFIKMLAERYLNVDKILQTARFLGIAEEVAAQIIIYTQMRDAIRQIAPRYYRNPRHREEILKAFLDALERLEEEEEENEEEEEEK